MTQSLAARLSVLVCLLLLAGPCLKAQTIATNTKLSSLSQKLVDFSGRAQNNTISLTWKTTVPVEKEYFSIQRSTDATEWEDIGKANTNNNQPNSFSFTDNNPSEANVYYRLKIEHEQHLEYSSMISVKFSLENNKPKIFPNPTKNVIWIKSEQTMNIENRIDLEVYNVLGEKVYASTMQNDLQKVDLSNYQNGYYYFNIGSKTYKVLKE